MTQVGLFLHRQQHQFYQSALEAFGGWAIISPLWQELAKQVQSLHSIHRNVCDK